MSTGLHSLNTGHERKPSKAVCLTAGVALIVVAAALAYSFLSPRDRPQETSTTSAMPTTTTIPGTGISPRLEDLDVPLQGASLRSSTTSTATTVEEKPSTTTSAPTPASTTTTLSITCYRNLDCGIEVEKRVCYLENVYLRRITPICKRPGLLDSYCISQESWATGSIVSEPIPLEKCRNRCVNGTCQ